MRTTTPDEAGWYWAEQRTHWSMAFVDTAIEAVRFYDGDNPGDPDSVLFDSPLLDEVLRWFGPFTCPGGPFGGDMVVLSAERHEEADDAGKAIVLTHIDYRYCRDEQHGSSITMTGLYSREEATAFIKREVL